MLIPLTDVENITIMYRKVNIKLGCITLKTKQYVHTTNEPTLKIDPVLIHQRYS